MSAWTLNVHRLALRNVYQLGFMTGSRVAVRRRFGILRLWRSAGTIVLKTGSAQPFPIGAANARCSSGIQGVSFCWPCDDTDTGTTKPGYLLHLCADGWSYGTGSGAS